MKRITRNRRLTSEEAAEYRAIREQVAVELPELVARHHERLPVGAVRREHALRLCPG